MPSAIKWVNVEMLGYGPRRQVPQRKEIVACS